MQTVVHEFSCGVSKHVGVVEQCGKLQRHGLYSCHHRDQGYYYYTRSQEGQQYVQHCRRAVPSTAGPPSETDEVDNTQPEEVVLDENQRKTAGNYSFYMVCVHIFTLVRCLCSRPKWCMMSCTAEQACGNMGGSLHADRRGSAAMRDDLLCIVGCCHTCCINVVILWLINHGCTVC